MGGRGFNFVLSSLSSLLSYSLGIWKNFCISLLALLGPKDSWVSLVYSWPRVLPFELSIWLNSDYWPL